MQCRTCGRSNHEGVGSCAHCGSALTIGCVVCSGQNPANTRFCGHCGAPLVLESGRRGSLPPAAAEHRQITVLFCDVVSSTALAARLGAEDLRNLLLDYQRRCAEAVGRFNGYIAQYLGDGVLAYFGYPTSHEDSAKCAVLAGLAIVEAMKSATRLQEGALQVRVGIHTGPVVVGEMGTAARRELLAIGETPNVAARIQSAASIGEVVVSDATYRIVQGYFEIEALGTLNVKGLQEPVSLLRILGETGASRLDVAARVGLTPLVARDTELQHLRTLWSESVTGEGAMVLLSGEAGIGKSRLARALRDEITASGPIGRLAPTLECNCSPLHKDTALRPWIELLQRELGLVSAPQDEQLARLTAGLSALSLHAQLPVLASLLSLDAPSLRRAPLPSLKERTAVFEAILAWLAARAAMTPTLLVFEDAQWADPSTLELLGLMTSRPIADHLVVLVTHRPELKPTWYAQRVVPVTLNRVSLEDAERIVADVMREHPFAEATLREVLARADGVPLYLEEITKCVLESMQAQVSSSASSGSSVSPGSVRSVPIVIPPTVRDSLVERIDRLGPGKPLLQLAATLGHTFSFALIHAVADLDPAALRSELDRLIGLGLLRRSTDPAHESYIFHHSLIEDAAYESLLRSSRQELHKRAAEALVAGVASAAESEPHLLARHYAAASMPRQAVAQWDLAGKRALSRSAYAEAEAIYGKALDMLATEPETTERNQREVALRTSLGVALISTRGYAASEVLDSYARAHELCERSGELPIGVLYGIWGVYLVRSDREITAHLAESFERIRAAPPDPLHSIIACSTLGVRAFFRGEYELSRSLFAEAIGHYDRNNALTQAQQLLSLHGYDGYLYPFLYTAWITALRGDPDLGYEIWKEAMQIAEALEHPYDIVMALNFGAVLALDFLEDEELAREMSTREMALSIEHGFPFWIATGSIHLGMSDVHKGEVETGIAQITSGLWLLEASGAAIVIPFHRAYLAQAYLESGQIKDAVELIDENIETAQSQIAASVTHVSYRQRGDALARQGDSAGAEASYRHAIELAHDCGNRWLELTASVSLAKLLNTKGTPDEARDVLESLLASFPPQSVRPLIATARELVAHA